MYGTATPAAGTVNILHVKNTDVNDKLMTITYIRCQIVAPANGSALPDTGNYFALAFGETNSSGGSGVTAKNGTSGSAKTASVTGHESAPTLAGTAGEFDRYYPKSDGDEVVWNKEGALIVPPGETFAIKYVGDHTAGVAFARISFVMDSEH